MSERCTAISVVVCFLFSFAATVYIIPGWLRSLYHGPGIDTPTLMFQRLSISFPDETVTTLLRCNLSDAGVKSLSLKSFIQALTTDEDPQDFRLTGLAVTSNLKNACQPPNDVSKAKIQVNKIALVTLENETVSCPLQDLAVNAQNAGYSVLIYFGNAYENIITPTVGPTQEKIMIPVIISKRKCNDIDVGFGDPSFRFVDDRYLVAADQTFVEIRMPVSPPHSEELSKMETYLNRLHWWYLVGPIITVVWMMRTKRKFCLLSGGQQVNDQEDQVAGNEIIVESEIRTMEGGENRTDESQLHFSAEQATPRNHQERHGEEQPLLTSWNNDSVRRARVTRCVNSVRKFLNKAAECFGHLILILAALPVGISNGELSFFRFDEAVGDYYKLFLYFQFELIPLSILITLLTLWWLPFQIFCFLMYSRFTCKAKWTVPTKFSKLIRSDWFASNIYLLVLGVVYPYCSVSNTTRVDIFGYFAIYNTLSTFCNMLFLIILNKHKVVTRYVFYISVCMICAYVESDIVALFYFALNSQGSLNNLKLTALRTAAIGLTLVVSFRTSMHIIRKLTTPRQSLFEGLGEQ